MAPETEPPPTVPDRTPEPDAPSFLDQAGPPGALFHVLIAGVAIGALLAAQVLAYLFVIRPVEAFGVERGLPLVSSLGWYGGLFGSFGSVLLVLVLATRSRPRGFLSLITPRDGIDWGLLVRSALLWGAISTAAILISAGIEGERPRPDLDVGLLLAVVATTAGFILIQVTAEEALFRGWLSQGLRRRLRHPALVALPVAVLFALVHLGTHVGLATFVMLAATSLLLSWLTWRADRLEPAIGLHFAQNATGLYIVGWELIPSPSVFPPVETMTVGWENFAGFAIAAALYGLIGVRWGLVIRR